MPPLITKIFQALCLLIFTADAGTFAANEDYIITGQNTARKVIIRTSSQLSTSYRAVKAFDADNATCWISAAGPGPHWISVDFGVKRLMTAIIVRPGKKDGYRTLKSFTLQFMDGDWFDFASIDALRKESVSIELGGVDASMFRIFIPAGGTEHDHAAIAEIEIYLGSSRVQFFDERLRGLCLPVRNAYLPAEDYCYPNAPRTYRGGRHAGIDLYHYYGGNSYTPVPLTRDTPIYAADSGIVIRADREYRAPTSEEWNHRSAYFRTHPSTFMKRSFGGREVWIDHRNGIVTAYNHLSRLDRSLRVGSLVSKGDRIGWAGNSGLAGEAQGRDYGIHLHFEIWIDGCYLGFGMSPAEVRKYLNWIFFPGQ
ncbi:MAG TPA: peptidoglycan DD-metalloendopeptidase family protein [Spirochaetota bacterium]|nr:peptidoglycan DD-metalloendopeptidase family protein [Spirochaetota bacterium]